MSVRKSISSPFNCSGDMYAGEPTPDTCVTSLRASCAAPKSATLMSSSPESIPLVRMLAGFMSRCTTPSVLANSSALQHL